MAAASVSAVPNPEPKPYRSPKGAEVQTLESTRFVGACLLISGDTHEMKTRQLPGGARGESLRQAVCEPMSVDALASQHQESRRSHRTEVAQGWSREVER